MHFITNILGFISANVSLSAIILQANPQLKEVGFVQYLILNGGIAGVLFVIWWFTYKMSAKQSADSTAQNQLQQQQTLEILQKNFTDSLDQNNKTLERMFSIQVEDAKYKAMIAENLVKLSTKIDMQDRRLPQ